MRNLVVASMAIAVGVLACIPSVTYSQTSKVIVPVPTLGVLVTYGGGAGARVHSVNAPPFGQLGNIQFQQGDVILAIGGVNVVPGLSIDTLIAQANATGNRYVRVLDVNSNTVLVLPY